MIGPDNPPVLYILMRTDLPDYLPGKSMAQANHAGTLFVRDMEIYQPLDAADQMKNVFLDWITDGDGFGTCVVLGCRSLELDIRMLMARGARLPHGLVHDPSYPIRDGHLIHHIPVTTCGYVFGPKDLCQPVTALLSLYKDT